MKHDQVLRIGSLAGKNKIRDAARHNLRELPQEPHIDAARSHLNRVLYGAQTAAEVAQQAKAMMASAEIKPRANAILGVEVLVCLPASFNGDSVAFFADALAWADEYFQVPILSAVVHSDESAQHMHIILLPIIDGRLQGSVVMGDRKRIQAMQGDFYASVGKRYGLRRKTAHRRAKVDRRNAAQKIMDAITANPALLNGGQIKNLLLDLIAQSPEPFAASLGMDLPEPQIKESFVEIMTKPQRSERNRTSIGDRQTPIVVSEPAVASENSPETANSYALLGVSDLRASVAVADLVLDDEPATVNDADFVRVRDDEIGAECWDAERGELIRPSAKVSRQARADHAVRMALSAIGRYR